jgi:hypothetical protein
MPEYIVKYKSRKFALAETASKAIITEVVYKSMFSSKVHFNIGENEYEINPNNIWETKFDLLKNGVDIGDIVYNWKGEVVLKLKNRIAMTKYFLLKNISILSTSFILKDYLTNELWTLKPVWNWKGLNTNFEITKMPGFAEEDNEVNQIELLIMALYAIQLISRNHS